MQNEAVTELSAGTLGNVTFQEIYIWNSNLATVDPSVVLSSKDRLEHLSIESSRLTNFPFDLLPQMPLLRTLSLADNSLKSVPAVTSPSLEDLDVSLNEIDALVSDWSVPSLKKLNISEYNHAYQCALIVHKFYYFNYCK